MIGINTETVYLPVNDETQECFPNAITTSLYEVKRYCRIRNITYSTYPPFTYLPTKN